MIQLKIEKIGKPRANCKVCNKVIREYKVTLSSSKFNGTQSSHAGYKMITYFTCGPCLAILKAEARDNVHNALSKIIIPNVISKKLEERELNIHAII